MLAPRRPLVRRPGDPVERPGRMPRHRRARVGLARRAGAAPARAGQRARLRRRAVRAHQRPARIGRDRARARGRQRAAQHRRGRHRPGLEHGADADLRRGAAGCRSSASRSPAPTPTARRTTGAPPRAASPTSTGRVGGRRRRRGRAPAQGARRRDARVRASTISSCVPGGKVGDQGRARSKAVSFADDLRPRALGRRRPDHRHATAGCSTRRPFDPKRAVAHRPAVPADRRLQLQRAGGRGRGRRG